MDEQTKNNPQTGAKKDDACCSHSGFCFCRALLALAIIALVWLAPTWADIAITVLAVLIVLGAGGCACRRKKAAK